MYKVFYKDRIVFFIENDENLITGKYDKVFYFKNKNQLAETLNEFLIKNELYSLYVVCKHIEIAFKEFSKLFTLIEAAGGLVKTPDNKYLFIFRRNKWDLPKGKLEINENSELGAIREVEEECGTKNLHIEKKLLHTHHIYQLDGTNILKRTYWYEMFHDGNQKPKPQLEEDITEAKWLDKNDLEMVRKNTFPLIIDVLKAAGVI